eukprot:scaffold81725_cov19-Tisochrysis_lutea.AAC.1
MACSMHISYATQRVFCLQLKFLPALNVHKLSKQVFCKISMPARQRGKSCKFTYMKLPCLAQLGGQLLTALARSLIVYDGK